MALESKSKSKSQSITSQFSISLCLAVNVNYATARDPNLDVAEIPQQIDTAESFLNFQLK